MSKSPLRKVSGAVYSGHFMCSELVEDGEEHDDCVEKSDPGIIEKVEKDVIDKMHYSPYPSEGQKEETIQDLRKKFVDEASLIKLFQCMSLAYKHKLTSPKWNNFRGLKIRRALKIRLNNLIWRTWHYQYVKRRKHRFCLFSIENEFVHTAPEAVVLEGKYWKRKITMAAAEYRKVRMFFHNRDKKKENIVEIVSNDVDMLLDFPDIDTSFLDQLEPMLVDDNLFNDNLLLQVSNQPVTLFPDPREMAQQANADFIQPGLLELQPNFRESYPTNFNLSSYFPYDQFSSSGFSSSGISSSESVLSESSSRSYDLYSKNIIHRSGMRNEGTRTSSFTSIPVPVQGLSGSSNNQGVQVQQSVKMEPVNQIQQNERSGESPLRYLLMQKQKTKNVLPNKSNATGGCPVATISNFIISPQMEQLGPNANMMNEPLSFKGNEIVTSYHSNNVVHKGSLPAPTFSSIDSKSRQYISQRNSSVRAMPPPCSSGKIIKRKTSSPNYSDSPSSIGKSDRFSESKASRSTPLSGFEALLSHLPASVRMSNSQVKLSKAAILNKSIDFITQLKQERENYDDEELQLKAEISSLNEEIRLCQSQLPDTGVLAMGGRTINSEQVNNMFFEYRHQRTLENERFYVFSLIAKRLLDSYEESVSNRSMNEFCQTLSSWIEHQCSLPQLRPIATQALNELCTSTCILNSPELFAQNVKEKTRSSVPHASHDLVEIRRSYPSQQNQAKDPNRPTFPRVL